jgi:hypothetical protein
LQDEIEKEIKEINDKKQDYILARFYEACKRYKDAFQKC